jgi:hypothetical protein
MEVRMKKLCLVLVILIIPAALFAQDFKVGAGAKGGITFYNYNVSYSGLNVGENMTNLLAGAFLDLTYVRLDIDYEMFLSGQVYTPFGTADIIDTSIGYLDFTLLGKYPFKLGMIKLWPAVGARFALPLIYTMSGTNVLEDPTADLADFYIMAGGGVDIDLGGVFITVQALYGFNLTPNQTTTTPPAGYTLSGSDIEISAGVGFTF